MESNTIKIEKKRYVKCPQCNSIARIKMNLNDPSWFMKQILFGGRLASLFTSQKGKQMSGKACKECGNQTGLKFIFLNTEIGPDGTELAYYIEGNIRVSLNG